METRRRWKISEEQPRNRALLPASASSPPKNAREDDQKQSKQPPTKIWTFIKANRRNKLTGTILKPAGCLKLQNHHGNQIRLVQPERSNRCSQKSTLTQIWWWLQQIWLCVQQRLPPCTPGRSCSQTTFTYEDKQLEGGVWTGKNTLYKVCPLAKNTGEDDRTNQG